jgi:hypothetical protein
MTYEQALAAFRNEVNRKFPPQMSSTTKTRRKINEVGSGQGCGGRFGRADHGGRSRGGRGNRNRPAKKRNDSTYITLSNGQEVEYHASFHFPPAIFNKMKDADRERMLRERKEYNKSRDQNCDQGCQIQQLQQQLSVAHSVSSGQHQHQLPHHPPAPTDKSVGQVSQISHGSTMFGGRNEQAHYRQRRPP